MNERYEGVGGMVTVLGTRDDHRPLRELTVWGSQSSDLMDKCINCFETTEERCWQKVLLGFTAGLAELETSYAERAARWREMEGHSQREKEYGEGGRGGATWGSCSGLFPASLQTLSAGPLLGSVSSISVLHVWYSCPVICAGLEADSQGALGVQRRPRGGEKGGIGSLRKWVKKLRHVFTLENWVMHISRYFFLP